MPSPSTILNIKAVIPSRTQAIQLIHCNIQHCDDLQLVNPVSLHTKRMLNYFTAHKLHFLIEKTNKPRTFHHLRSIRRRTESIIQTQGRSAKAPSFPVGMDGCHVYNVLEAARWDLHWFMWRAATGVTAS